MEDNFIFNQNGVCTNCKKVVFKSKDFEYSIDWFIEEGMFIYAISFQKNFGNFYGHCASPSKKNKLRFENLNSCLVHAHESLSSVLNGDDFSEAKLNHVRDHLKTKINKLKFGQVQQLELF